MSIAKWIMKQYWRLGATRAWMSLGMGMLSIAKLYYLNIPILADLGFWGAVILGGILVIIFMGIGWLYDEKAKMWRAKITVSIDRNPYRSVPDFAAFATNYPVLYAMISTVHKFVKRVGIDTSEIEDLEKMLTIHYSLRPEKDEIEQAKDIGNEYMECHPFVPGRESTPGENDLTTKAMLGFETQNLRLTWIQELSGMLQDGLVITGVYIVFLFPGVVVDGAVPLVYLLIGIVVIALPIMFLITAVGWLYDRQLKVWSVDSAVKVERNPYSYLAEPRIHASFRPFYYAFFNTMENLLEKEGIEATEVSKMKDFLKDYFALRVDRDEDLIAARELRRSFGESFAEPNQAEHEETSITDGMSYEN